MTNIQNESDNTNKDEHEDQGTSMSEEPSEASASEVGQNDNDMDAKIAALTEEKAFYEDKYSRLAAEFENFKKRNRQEQEMRLKYATSSVVGGMLAGLDNLSRALALANKDEAMAENEFFKGIQMVYEQFHTALENHGVKKIASLGKLFDPACHESMGAIQSDVYEENHVVEVFREGYMLHDRVIRPAMVQIATKSAGQ